MQHWLITKLGWLKSLLVRAINGTTATVKSLALGIGGIYKLVKAFGVNTAKNSAVLQTEIAEITKHLELEVDGDYFRLSIDSHEKKSTRTDKRKLTPLPALASRYLIEPSILHGLRTYECEFDEHGLCTGFLAPYRLGSKQRSCGCSCHRVDKENVVSDEKGSKKI